MLVRSHLRDYLFPSLKVELFIFSKLINSGKDVYLFCFFVLHEVYIVLGLCGRQETSARKRSKERLSALEAFSKYFLTTRLG